MSFAIKGLRMSARTNSVRSRSISGSLSPTPTMYSTSGSASKRWASFPARCREIPVIITRWPTSVSLAARLRDDDRIAECKTERTRRAAAVSNQGQPAPRVDQHGELAGIDLGERGHPADLLGPPHRSHLQPRSILEAGGAKVLG